MSNGNSVAPKQRVNIVYNSASSGAQEAEELPLKLLVLGDFSRSEDRLSLEDRAPIRIDKDNFNEVLDRQQVSLSLVVPNQLSSESASALRVTIPIRSLDDFSPDKVAAAVPALKQLLELREALGSLRTRMNQNPELGQRIESCLHDADMRKRLLRELEQQSDLDDKGV